MHLSSRRRSFIACAVVLTLGASACGSDDDGTISVEADNSEAGATTIASDTTIPMSEIEVPDEPGMHDMWPAPDVTYDTAEEATLAFTKTVLGFPDPVIGTYTGNDLGGVIEAQPKPDGPVTRVLLSERAGGGWAVAATETVNIVPSVLVQKVDDTLTLSGHSTAYEGTVDWKLTDVAGNELGSGFVTGGANGEMGGWELSAPIQPTSADKGILIFYTQSAEDGSVMEASSQMVTFAR